MKKIYTLSAMLLFMGAFMTFNKVSAQTSSGLPSGYPKFVDTGNPQEDHQRFDLAKRDWIKANPDAYAKMEGGTAVTKQTAVVPNPVEVKTIAEPKKETGMVPSYSPGQYPAANVESELNSAPNPDADKALRISKAEFEQLSAEKKEQVLQHPDLYMISDEPAQPVEKKKVTMEDLQNMSSEKSEFIKAHPELYELPELK
jgi:hypothetical protein